jgi:hypothetical protein
MNPDKPTVENIGQPVLPPSVAEQRGSGIEISVTKEMAMVLFHDLKLDAANPTSPEVTVVVEKRPVELVEGESYGSSSVLIDSETEKMQDLAKQAQALLELPEHERPAKVLEIFRHNMHYAYNDVIEQLSKVDPDKAQWVGQNTGLKRKASSNVPLSKIFENEHGVCGYLAVAYLWLAQKAGLKGVLLGDQGAIKNIERSDTGQPLFRSVAVGKPVSAHAWVEIKTSDGQWIPADPSTGIVGDTEEGLAMFREANYMASGNLSLYDEAEPREQLYSRDTPIFFAPAESTGSGKYCLELRSAIPPLIKRKDSSPVTSIPFSGEGRLKITSRPVWGLALDIVDVSERLRGGDSLAGELLQSALTGTGERALEAVMGIVARAREELEKNGKYPLALVPVEERDVAEKENNAIIKRCFDELLALKDGFEKVFETEQGSTYFLLKSGEVVRIKKKDAGYYPNSWYLPPMTKDIFFVSAGEMQKVINEYHKILSGKTINVVKCAVGVHPIELNTLYDDVLVYDEVGSDRVTFKGHQFSDGFFSNNVTAIHCGNKITRIIK